jgi:hypothetical protein
VVASVELISTSWFFRILLMSTTYLFMSSTAAAAWNFWIAVQTPGSERRFPHARMMISWEKTKHTHTRLNTFSLNSDTWNRSIFYYRSGVEWV